MKNALFIFTLCLTMMCSPGASAENTDRECEKYTAVVFSYEEADSIETENVYKTDKVSVHSDTDFDIESENEEEFSTTEVVKLEAETFSFGILIRSIGIGVVAAVVIVGAMAAQHKSVSKKYGAAEYVKKDSFVVTENKDIFLYKNVIKSERPKQKK